MSNHTCLPSPSDALAGFVNELLGVGGVLSQIIAHMARFDAALGADPDAVPIPAAAHELLMGTLEGLKRRYSRRDLKVAATMLKEAANTICVGGLLRAHRGAPGVAQCLRRHTTLGVTHDASTTV